MRNIYASAALVLAIAGSAFANEPQITITSPTGALYVNQFPFSAPITFSIYHGPSTTSPSTTSELKNVHVLQVSVNGTPLVDFSDGGPLGKPFDSNNQCSNQMNIGNGILNCSASDANNATVTVPWTISGPGSYVLLVSVKHKNEVGEDTETVQVYVVTAGYPAPPSIANAYINSVAALKSGAAKIRGCVLNEIAREHGQNNKYGPQGGPYNDPLVRHDVFVFWTGACAAPWPNGVIQP
jgi:hypothetical protein